MTSLTPEQKRIRFMAIDYLEGFVDDAQDEARDNLENVRGDYGLRPDEEEAFLTEVRSAQITYLFPGDKGYTPQ